MAIKTFTTGEVLTAADTNTYLNNGGLVLITSGITVTSAGGSVATVSNGTVTIGTNNTSITVNNAFSSTYDSYRVIIFGENCSANGALLLQFSGATGNTYYTNLSYFGWGSAVVNGYGPAATNKSLISQIYGGGPYQTIIDLQNPNKPTRTFGNYQEASINNSGVGQIMETSTAQHTGFTLTTDGPNLTGGTIRIYGYRQP